MLKSLTKGIAIALAVVGLVVGQAVATANLQPGVIQPGVSIGQVALGEDQQTVLTTVGASEFTHDNDDGTTLIEWGLLNSADLPDAALWVLVDNGKVAKIGTDGGGLYRDSHGLGVGDSVDKYFRAYGAPDNNPAPGFYSYNIGIGFAVSQRQVHTIWVEAPTTPAQ